MYFGQKKKKNPFSTEVSFSKSPFSKSKGFGTASPKKYGFDHVTKKKFGYDINKVVSKEEVEDLENLFGKLNINPKPIHTLDEEQREFENLLSSALDTYYGGEMDKSQQNFFVEKAFGK